MLPFHAASEDHLYVRLNPKTSDKQRLQGSLVETGRGFHLDQVYRVVFILPTTEPPKFAVFNNYGMLEFLSTENFLHVAEKDIIHAKDGSGQLFFRPNLDMKRLKTLDPDPEDDDVPLEPTPVKRGRPSNADRERTENLA